MKSETSIQLRPGLLLTSYNAQNSPQHRELWAPDAHSAKGEKVMCNRRQVLVTLRDGVSDREGARGPRGAGNALYIYMVCTHVRPIEPNIYDVCASPYVSPPSTGTPVQPRAPAAGSR